MSNPYLTNNLAGGVTTLATGIDNATLTIVVASAVAASIPASCAGTRVRIGDELITLASRATNTLTAATRGVEGTAAAAHNQNDVVSVFATAGAFDDWAQALINNQLAISNATQLTERLRFAGQEFFAAAHTDTNGPTLLCGVNRSGNRQLWIADSAALTQNTTNSTLWFKVGNGESQIGARATDGSTNLRLQIQPNGGNINMASLPTSASGLSTGDLWNNAGVMNIKA